MFKLRHLIAAVALAGVLAPAFATADRAPAGESLKFGTAVTEKKPVNIAKLAKAPARFMGQTVRLEGIVKQVCQGRGCWVEVMAGPNGKSFIAKSLDESILLPKDCAGRRIAVQGVVTTLTPENKEEHDCAKEGHDASHAEGHVCPQPTYLVSTQGVELAAK